MHVVSIPLQGMGIVFLLLLQKMGYSLAYVTGYKSAPGAVTTFLKTKQLSTAAFKQSNHKVSTPPHTQTQGVESTCQWRMKRRWTDLPGHPQIILCSHKISE